MIAPVTIGVAYDRHVVELAACFLDPLENGLNVCHSNRDNPYFGSEQRPDERLRSGPRSTVFEAYITINETHEK